MVPARWRFTKHQIESLYKPHFLDGERSLWKSVEGLSPSEKYHNSHLLVDQNTGVILKSEINFQTNIELNRWALKQANISGMICYS